MQFIINVSNYLGILLLVALEGLEERGALPGHHVADEGLALEGVLADLDVEDDIAFSDDSYFAHGGLAVLEAPGQKRRDKP